MMYRNFDTNELWAAEDIRETYEAEASLYEKYPDFEAYLDHLLDLGRAGEGGIVVAEAYILVDARMSGDEFVEEFETAKDAVEAGEEKWSRMTLAEKRRTREFYVLESVSPDEEAEDHFDGNYVRAWLLEGKKNADEAQKALDDALEEIADECEEEGYPRNGSNYSLRAAETLKWYEEIYPEYWFRA